MAVFVTVGIVLTGAWFGFWGVRKFVLSEDGSVDFGTAQFVKWAIRILAVVTILQVISFVEHVQKCFSYLWKVACIC